MLPKWWYIISGSHFPFCYVIIFQEALDSIKHREAIHNYFFWGTGSGHILFMLSFFHCLMNFSFCFFLHNLTVPKVGFNICLHEGWAGRICLVEVCTDQMQQGWKHGGDGVCILWWRHTHWYALSGGRGASSRGKLLFLWCVLFYLVLIQHWMTAVFSCLQVMKR